MTEIREVDVRGGRGGTTAVVLLICVAILAVTAYFLLQNDKRETNAVTGAAKEVSQAADAVTDTAKDAAKDK